MAPTPDDRLADLADAMLAAVVARYTMNGLTLPPRQYTHVGEVAYDCEEVVATLESIYPGLPGEEAITAPPRGGAFVATARMALVLVRCVPAVSDRGKAPTAAQLNAAGQAALIDAREVLKALTGAASAGDFTPYCTSVSYFGTEFVGPQGAFLGSVTRFDVQL